MPSAVATTEALRNLMGERVEFYDWYDIDDTSITTVNVMNVVTTDSTHWIIGLTTEGKPFRRTIERDVLRQFEPTVFGYKASDGYADTRITVIR